MTSPQLLNYLRAHRKRLGLSQDDVAYLLGVESGAKVCRYERFVREPGLRAALACEVIFQRPIRELFPGLYQQIERDVACRARALTRKMDRQGEVRRGGCKRQALSTIGGPKTRVLFDNK